MLTLPPSTRIFIAAKPTDMRRGFDGLLALVRDYMGGDPFSGHLFVFRNRAANLIKVLWWDRDGLALFSKRLERGKFTFFIPAADAAQLEMTAADLQLVLQGIDPRTAKRTRRYQRPADAAP
jgi:transposase